MLRAGGPKPGSWLKVFCPRGREAWGFSGEPPRPLALTAPSQGPTPGTHCSACLSSARRRPHPAALCHQPGPGRGKVGVRGRRPRGADGRPRSVPRVRPEPRGRHSLRHVLHVPEGAGVAVGRESSRGALSPPSLPPSQARAPQGRDRCRGPCPGLPTLPREGGRHRAPVIKAGTLPGAGDRLGPRARRRTPSRASRARRPRRGGLGVWASGQGSRWAPGRGTGCCQEQGAGRPGTRGPGGDHQGSGSPAVSGISGRPGTAPCRWPGLEVTSGFRVTQGRGAGGSRRGSSPPPSWGGRFPEWPPRAAHLLTCLSQCCCSSNRGRPRAPSSPPQPPHSSQRPPASPVLPTLLFASQT